MFGLGPQELLLIFIIVLILFGAKRLPEIGSAFGRSIREFKKASSRDKDEVSTLISAKQPEERATATETDEKDESLKRQVENVPGIKEAQEIKKTAGKIKAASRFFLKK